MPATLFGPKPERREHGLERPIYCSNKLLRTHTHTLHCVVFVTFARHRSSRRCRAASVSFPSATRISIFVLACPSVDPFHQCLTSSAPHFAKFHAAFVSPLNGASPPPVAVSRVTLRRYGFFFRYLRHVFITRTPQRTISTKVLLVRWASCFTKTGL